jgi:hypothetical protein
VQFFVRWIPYILAISTIIGGAVDLYLKREEYKSRRLRQGVIFLFILTGLLTIVGLYHENEEKEKASKKAEASNTELKGKMDAAMKAENTAIQDQRNNTEVFARQFKALSVEVGDLKTQVRTEALQKKLDSVQAELLNTQKAMAPGPKATLVFTFFPFTNSSSFEQSAPVTDINLPIMEDGSVHIEFAIVNFTAVDALNVSINLGIPDGCRFAKEPEGFKKVPGNPDTQRFIALPQIHALEFLRPISTNIVVPGTMSQFSMGITYRCNTCVLTREASLGTVHVTRDFLRPVK